MKKKELNTTSPTYVFDSACSALIVQVTAHHTTIIDATATCPVVQEHHSHRIKCKAELSNKRQWTRTRPYTAWVELDETLSRFGSLDCRRLVCE